MSVAAAVDPTTLAVVQGWMGQIANEMDLTLVRSAFSTVISEQCDRACGLYSADDGGTIVQGTTGLPMFVGSMQFAVSAVREKLLAEGDAAPGDVYCLNDPYLAGTHLHDVKLVQPFFHDGVLSAYLAATGHWMDVGSSAPGGWNPFATDMLQEGLRIPPVKIVHAGRLDQDLLALILANLRLPRDARGDFQAKLNALRVGEQRLAELFTKYGAPTVAAVIAEGRQRAEQHMRSYLAELPDGVYEYEDYLDDDGVTAEPLRVHVRATVSGTDLALDFSGSSPPCKGPYNTAAANTIAASYIALKHLYPDVPLNAGSLAPLRFTIPATTFLAASFPMAHEGYLDVGERVKDCVLGALAQACPERAVGAPFGTLPIVSLSGVDPRSGRYYLTILFAGGGYGGSRATDGLVNGALSIGIARAASVEVMEQRFPVRYQRYAIRPDTGGAGWHVGGCGSECEVEVLGDQTLLSDLADRMRTSPFGVLGGQPGARTELYLERDGARRPLGKEMGVELCRGDRLVLRYPGGGGYGDPATREHALVVRDVRRGYLSPDRARAVYGVEA
jgi:N-methylhydantoinase B